LRLYCALQAIDQAADALNAYKSTYVLPKKWIRVKTHQQTNAGYLNKKTQTIILPKTAAIFPPQRGANEPWWLRAKKNGQLEDIPERGTHLHRCFHNICALRIPIGTKLNYQVLPQLKDLDDTPWDTLKIGFVPLVQELEITAPNATLKPGPLRMPRRRFT
jgi:hypothetical protein